MKSHTNKYLLKGKILFKKNYITIAILFFFFAGYLILSINKHLNFLSGYDLSIIDQAIWKYSHFKNPVTTTHVYYDAAIYTDHLELIFVLIAPLYRLFDSAITLIVLQVISVIGSGAAVFLIAGKFGLKKFVANSVLFSYLIFFGIQFAIWSDVHSLVFAIGFMAWFYYFLISKKLKLMLLFLTMSLLCKEDIALLTLLISMSQFIYTKSRTSILAMVISLLYLLVVFTVYFPILMGGYKYANPQGIFSDTNPMYMVNTVDKRNALLYSLGSFGFLPVFAPFFLIPFLGDLAHYIVLGNAIVTSAHGIFAHYRSSVSLLLIIPTIIAISKVKKNNNKFAGLYLIACALFFQYYLHLPLSYLAKSWFWKGSPEKISINTVINELPKNASIVTHNNIASHIAHRENIYTLFPYLKDFKKNSPCGAHTCKWFRVGGNPELLLIDTGTSWNILHYLSQREEFLEAISNLKKNGNITLIKKIGTTELYKITKKI